MNDEDPTCVERSWRVAHASDVVRALSMPDDYEREELAVIKREAERRQLERTNCDRTLLRTPEKVIRVLYVIHRFLSVHRCIAVTLPGVLVPVCGAFFSPWDWLGAAWPIWSTGLCLVYLGGLAGSAWPLRSYNVAVRTTLVASACFASVGFLNVLLTFPGHASKRLVRGIMSAPLLFIGLWAVSCLILCVVVLLRKRYWPVYAPGQCVRCGYDLRGLPNPRCPECGTSFTTPEPRREKGEKGSR